MNPLPQDLHIHTTFSRHDSAVVPEQTLQLVAAIAAAVTGMAHLPLCAVKAAADGAGTMVDADEVVYVRVSVVLSNSPKSAE